MPDLRELFTSLSTQAAASLHRSDVLKPLAWLIGLLIIAAGVFLYAKAPIWLIIGVGSLAGLAVLLYFGAYVFCLISNPDALRSEHYSIQKLAIEKRVLGDSKTGMFELPLIANNAPTDETPETKKTIDRIASDSVDRGTDNLSSPPANKMGDLI